MIVDLATNKKIIIVIINDEITDIYECLRSMHRATVCIEIHCKYGRPAFARRRIWHNVAFKPLTTMLQYGISSSTQEIYCLL